MLWEILTGCPSSNITAGKVDDRYSLRDFVLSAKNYLEDDYEHAIVDFQKENSDWWSEEVYLFILDERSKVYLHPKHPFLENQEDLRIQDQETGKYIRDLIFEAAAKRRGDWIKYKLEGTPQRIAYAVSFTQKRDILIMFEF